MIIADPARFARLGALVDKALGYPREADTRGSHCPPAPFGRTERYTSPHDRDDDTFFVFEIPTAVSNIVGASSRLTGLERAEYALLIAGAQSGGAQAAKENRT